MKVTARQLNDIIKYVINESSEEKEVYIEPLTVIDEESGVEAVLSYEDKHMGHFQRRRVHTGSRDGYKHNT